MGRQTWEHSIDRESRALEVYLQIAKECLRTFSNTVNTSHPMMTWVVPMGVGSVYGWSPMRGNRALNVRLHSATLLYICTTSVCITSTQPPDATLGQSTYWGTHKQPPGPIRPPILPIPSSPSASLLVVWPVLW